MKDLRIVARIYNNQLRERREATGLTQRAFAKSIGVQPAHYCAAETMRVHPVTSGVGPFGTEKPKSWRPWALSIASALGVEPDVLWPEAVREIKKTVSEIRVDASDLVAMLPPAESNPFRLLSSGEETQALTEALKTLGEREREIIERHHLDGESLTVIAEGLGFSHQYASQVEAKAMKKLRKNALLRDVARARSGV